MLYILKRRKMKNRIDLRVDCYEVVGHPQIFMATQGITYKLSVPQSIADQWWFFDCKNVPDPLPKGVTHLGLDIKTLVGYGLSMQDVAMLESTEVEPEPEPEVNETDYVKNYEWKCEKEINEIRAEAEANNIEASEVMYIAVDKLIWSLKESGMYSKIDCLHLPPFIIKGTETTPMRAINLKRE